MAGQRGFSLKERLLWAAIFAAAFALVPLQVIADDVTSNAEEVNGVPTNMIMWSSIVGFFLPLAIAIPKREHWPSWVKGLFAFFCCLVAALGTAYFSGDLTQIRDYATAALFVVFSALGSYKLLWGPEASGIETKLSEKTG